MDLFRLNDKIELRSENDINVSGYIYDTKEDKLYIAISADDGNFKLLSMGENLKGTIYCGSEVIGFEATVTARVFTNTSVYELSNIKNLTRIQRRENIRLELVKDIFYSDNEFLLKYDFSEGKTKDKLKEIDKYLKEGLMLDLSAGGMRISVRENFQMGEKLVLIIPFEDGDMVLKGEIVYKEINLIPKNTVYLYGMRFIDIEEGQQENIIRHLFVIMRKNRAK